MLYLKKINFRTFGKKIKAFLISQPISQSKILMKEWGKIDKKRQKLFLLISGFCLLILILTIGGSVFLQHNINSPLNHGAEAKIFIVEPGQTIKKIAENLDRQEFIRGKLYFLIYFKRLEKAFEEKLTLKAGKYLISPGESIPEITEKLIYGLVMPEEIKLTIPEGYNLFEIANLLEKKGIIKDKTDFIELAICKTNSKENHLYPWQALDVFFETKNSINNLCLEGYLFPDTYYFKEGQGEIAVIRKMVNNFKNKTAQLFEKMSLEEIKRILVSASLLEKEVTGFSDQRTVASILEKRILLGMPLQIDATVIYAKTLVEYQKNGEVNLGPRNHNPVTLKDLEIDSLYNTYKYTDFPPGPISNPGLNAIKAALNPIKTDYLYYLSDRAGTTYFAQTYEQHLANKAKHL